MISRLSKIYGGIKKLFSGFSYIIYPVFWLFNGIYLFLLLFNVSNKEFVRQAIFTFPNILISFVSIVGLLIISIITGFFIKNRMKLMFYLFGFELPVLVLLVLLLSIIINLTPVIWLLVISLVIGFSGFLLYLYDFKTPSGILKMILFLSQELLVIISLYTGILLAFFILTFHPFFMVILYIGVYGTFCKLGAMFSDFSNININEYFTLSMFLALFIIFYVCPYICIVLYCITFKNNYNELKKAYNPVVVDSVSIAFAIAFIIVVLPLSYQTYAKDYETQLTNINFQNSLESTDSYIFPVDKIVKILKGINTNINTTGACTGQN